MVVAEYDVLKAKIYTCGCVALNGDSAFLNRYSNFITTLMTTVTHKYTLNGFSPLKDVAIEQSSHTHKCVSNK